MNKYRNLTIEEIREEIYNDFIQEYYDLSHDEVTKLVDIELTKHEYNQIKYEK
jgi:predicted membrane chloride channel (bestrophin family)